MSSQPFKRLLAQESQASSISKSDILKLKRWNTPTIYNGWEQITAHDASHFRYNKEEVRDVDEMTDAGFKVLARRLAVGHAHACPMIWGSEVEVFGQQVSPGQLIHADKHGFLVIPREDEGRLVEAAAFMDGNECSTIIPAARDRSGLSYGEMIAGYEVAASEFRRKAFERYGTVGEW